MKLFKRNFTFDRSHYYSITSDLINKKFQIISSNISSVSLTVSPDNPLSPYYKSDGQLIIFNWNFSFQTFKSADELLLYSKLILSGVKREEALIALVKDSGQYPPSERFDKRRAELMFKVNLLKFYQNYELAVALFETEDVYLQVASNSIALDDNLFGKILMVIRTLLKTTMDENQLDKVFQVNKTRIFDLDLLSYADEINKSTIDHLYHQIGQQNLLGNYGDSIIIGQCNPLSHHFEGELQNTQITIMTHNFDLWKTTSAIRLYGAVKLMLNGRSKDDAYKYLDPTCSINKKHIKPNLNDTWRSRDIEIAFKANLLRYLQNPDVAQILVRTGVKRLLPSCYSKLSETTVRMHMIIRHFLKGQDLCLNTNAIKIEDCLSL